MGCDNLPDGNERPSTTEATDKSWIGDVNISGVGTLNVRELNGLPRTTENATPLSRIV